MQTARDKVLSDLRRELPHTAELLASRPSFADDLVTAWEHGATSSYSKHLLLTLLWSMPRSSRTSMLDVAVRAIAPSLSPANVHDFARRITGIAFRDATAAITELLVAGLFAQAEATVTFVARTDGKTNDLVATRGGATVHVEVASLNISDENERAGTRVQRALAAWPASDREIPQELRGLARQHLDPGGGFVRTCEYNVLPLGDGNAAKQIKRLARKKNDAQLRGRPQNKMLVNSFWHEFGVSRQLALPTFDGETGRHTGHVYAATYGVPGAPVFTGFRFDDEDYPTEDLEGPGILPRSQILAAVAWIFHKGAPVVFERLDGDPHFTDEARTLVRDALADDDGFSRLR
jgi:hypothetical protein